MARLQGKRKLIRHPGIFRAAKVLGCDYSHLRRVVVGERNSRSLMKRFREFLKTGKAPVASAAKGPHLNSPKAMPPSISHAAAENLSQFFFNTLSTLGLEVLIVRFEAGKDSLIFSQPGIELEIERELQAIQAGQFDSSFFPLGAHWHFFHVAKSDLGKAMQQVKSFLDKRGLLPITTLLHAETAGELREWYPATAQLIESK